MQWFKRVLMVVMVAVAFSMNAQASEKYLPFVLAYVTKGTVADVTNDVQKKLTDGGFQVVGKYAPYASAEVIGVTNNSLLQEAAQTEFGGYGAVQRVAVTKVGDDIQVTYTNPTYMAFAYRMKGDMADISAQLAKALGKVKEFGPENGLRESKLRKYHYMFGMEYFDDIRTHEIAEHKTYEDAVNAVEANLAKGTAGVTKVYRVDVPGKQETLFGVGMKMPKGGDKNMDDEYIMNEIDFKDIRSTAHLPYDILVSGNKTYALYARFRIAISFPDLAMMGEHSFMNIMESPEAIKRALSKASGGDYTKSYWENN